MNILQISTIHEQKINEQSEIMGKKQIMQPLVLLKN